MNILSDQQVFDLFREKIIPDTDLPSGVNSYDGMSYDEQKIIIKNGEEFILFTNVDIYYRSPFSCDVEEWGDVLIAQNDEKYELHYCQFKEK